MLDFIGNYRNAFLIESLLKHGTAEGNTAAVPESVISPERLPSGCIVDFDFRLIDLFKMMREKRKNIKERIIDIYEEVKRELIRIPSRCEFFNALTGEEIYFIRKDAKVNPFRNYVSFLKENNDYFKSLDKAAEEFITFLENTKMTKSYKIPLLLAFLDGSGIKPYITSKDMIESFKAFYRKGINSIDIENDRKTKNFSSWDDHRILTLIKSNPMRYLSESGASYFHISSDGVFALNDALLPFIEDQEFISEFVDTVNFRKMEYYQLRYENNSG